MKQTSIAVKKGSGQWLFLLSLFFLSGSTLVQAQSAYRFVRAFSGPDLGELVNPHGVGVDSSGSIYVTDTDNNRIQKFDNDGNFLFAFGTSGTGAAQFRFPTGVAVDSSGNVYVADTDNDRIQKFDSQGNFLLQFGMTGSSSGRFHDPEGIAVDSSGNVYVADTGNHRIQKFDSSGNFLFAIGGIGAANGQLYYPGGVAVDSSGSVYVADTGNNRLQKFSSHGYFLSAVSGQGSPGGFNRPVGIAVDNNANLFVADSNGVLKLDSNGHFLTSLGSTGNGDGQFLSPSGVAIDSSGAVYVADTGNNRVQVFAPTSNTQVQVASDTFTQFRGAPGQMITLKANLKRISDNTGLSGQTLTFKVDNTVVGTATTYVTGSAWLNGFKIPTSLSLGVHTLTVSFAGNAPYLPSTGAGTLTVALPDTKITVADENGQQFIGAPRQKITLKGYIRRSTDNAYVSNALLTFKVDGTAVGTATTGSTGTARLSYTIPAAASQGVHLVAITFAGNNNYGPGSGVGTLTVTPTDTRITVNDDNGQNFTGAAGQTIKLKGYLRRVTDNGAVSAALLTFKVDGNAAGTATTGDTGTASVSYKIPDTAALGAHTVTVAFAGSTNYNASSGTGTLTVTPGNTTITVADDYGQQFTSLPGGSVTLQATLKQSSDNLAVSGKTLTFKVDSTTVGTAATGTDGKTRFSYSIPATSSLGVHTITATFAGGGAYLASSGTGTLTLIPSSTETATQMRVSDASGMQGQQITLGALLTAIGNGFGVQNRKVIFKLDGQPAVSGSNTLGEQKTNDYGNAYYAGYRVPDNISAGAHTLTVEFAGDGTYLPSSGTGTLTVLPGNTKIIVPNIDGSQPGGPIGYTVTLQASIRLTMSGGGVSGVPLTFKVDGDVIGTATTNTNGNAMLPYKIPDDITIGSHTLTVEFVGNSNYNASSGTNTLMVYQSGVGITVTSNAGTPGQQITLHANLTRDSDRTVLSGKTLTFKVGTTVVGTATTGGDGSASLSYKIPATLSPGKYTITVSFAGDTSYSANSGTGTLTVN